MITYDDFAKIELRVGTITFAENHPNADRLMVLKVSLGPDDTRQIVAGIKQYYAVETLIGKQITVVTNLEPAVLRGVTSNGMLLAASDEAGNFGLVSPDKPMTAGAKVK